MRNIFFTPGPSALFYTAEDHIRKALHEQIPSISHRGTLFKNIFKETKEVLYELLKIPDHYHLLFTGSATEIWERLIQNCVEKKSFHITNGAFSQKFGKISGDLGKTADIFKVDDGSCFAANAISVPSDAELIAITQNETSTGAAQPLEDIYKLSQNNSDKILAVDIVSAVPYIPLDYHKIDAAYFSIQKGFGLPAGLGVWIINEKCITKSEVKKKKGASTGSYHSLGELVDKANKYQTPETPNVLGIYLLGKIAKDMLNKGIEQIRRETDYKAALLYNLFENHNFINPFVENENYRSKTVVVAKTKIPSQKVIDKLKEKNIIIGSGYGSYKNDHIRIANFPTHSKEQMEMLIDLLINLKL